MAYKSLPPFCSHLIYIEHPHSPSNFQIPSKQFERPSPPCILKRIQGGLRCVTSHPFYFFVIPPFFAFDFCFFLRSRQPPLPFILIVFSSLSPFFSNETVVSSTSSIVFEFEELYYFLRVGNGTKRGKRKKNLSHYGTPNHIPPFSPIQSIRRKKTFPQPPSNPTPTTEAFPPFFPSSPLHNVEISDPPCCVLYSFW